MQRAKPAMKVTPFGRDVRKLRIDHGETMADLASAVSVSVAFLSAVETGKKSAPPSLIAELVKHYHLDKMQARQLQDLADQSKTEMRINMSKASDEARELVAVFARRFSELSEAEVAKIKKALQKG